MYVRNRTSGKETEVSRSEVREEDRRVTERRDSLRGDGREYSYEH